MRSLLYQLIGVIELFHKAEVKHGGGKTSELLCNRLWRINTDICVTSAKLTGFFLGDGGREILSIPPSDTCPRFWTKACPSQPRFIPPKFEKFKYIFVPNLTTFKLKSTFKKLYFMLKIAKYVLILHKWTVLASVRFFSQVPPSVRGPTGTKNVEFPPPSKV